MTSTAFAAASAASATAVRLGAPLFIKTIDPVELAREHQRLGFSAAYCPSFAKLEDTAGLRAIEKAFADARVVIAEVGAWRNLLDPDAAKRRDNLAYVTSRLAISEELAAINCVDIAGSYNPDVWYGPHEKNFSREFFDAAVENARRIIDAVKPKRTKFSYEMMGWCLPSTADEYLRLRRAIDRPAFAVHVDVCNCINSPEKFYSNAAVIDDIFRKLDPHVTSCHAKDLAWTPEMNVHFVEVVPGRGRIDYRAYLKAIAALPHQPPLMLEHLKTAEEYAEGVRYIRETGRAAGVNFG